MGNIKYKEDISNVFNIFLEEGNNIAELYLVGKNQPISISLDNMFYTTTSQNLPIEKVLSFMESRNFNGIKGLFGILYKTDFEFLNTGILIKDYDIDTLERRSLDSSYNAHYSYSHMFKNSLFVSFSSIESISPKSNWYFDNHYISDIGAISLCMKLSGLLKNND